MQSIQEQAALRLANSIVTDQPLSVRVCVPAAALWQEVQSPSLLLKQMDYLISPSVNETFKQDGDLGCILMVLWTRGSVV